MTKGDFYTRSDLDLNIFEYYNKSSFEYPIYSLEANVSLYSERYIGYDKKCLIENGILNLENRAFNEEKIDEMNQVITKALFINDITKWLSIIFFVIELFCCNCYHLEAKNSVSWNVVWALRNILYHVGMALPLYFDLSKIKQFIQFPACGNALINAKLDYYNSTGKSLKTKIIWGIILVNVQLALIIIVSILRILGECEIFHEKRAPLVEHQKSTNIDYENTPEEAYYNRPDYKNNNPTSSADFNNSIDNNNLPENNNNINPSSVSSAEDNPNLHELQNY